MRRAVFAGTALAVLGVVAVAGAQVADPITTRQMVMKDNGAAMGALANMAKGDAPFEAVAANLAVRVVFSGMAGFPTLFPAGTETGGDTKAAPKIWEDAAGFEAEAAKLREAAAKLIATPITDLDGVKAALGALGPTCQSCHETYRLKDG